MITIPGSKVFQGEFGKHLSARISSEEAQMLEEMIAAWFPGKQRVEGAIIGRAIRMLYAQYQREQAVAEIYDPRAYEQEIRQRTKIGPGDPHGPQGR